MHIFKIIPFFCLLGFIPFFIHIPAHAGLKDSLEQNDMSKTAKRKRNDNAKQKTSKNKRLMNVKSQK